MKLLMLFSTALAASHHVERCRNTLQPALDSCHGDRDCRCGVLARAGQLCLKTAPSGSLMDLIRSVDSDCMRTHFMEINAFDNLLTTDQEFENFVYGNSTAQSAFSDNSDAPQRAEDLQDQRLAQKFVEWVDRRLEISHEAISNHSSPNSTRVDASPANMIGLPIFIAQFNAWYQQWLA